MKLVAHFFKLVSWFCREKLLICIPHYSLQGKEVSSNLLVFLCFDYLIFTCLKLEFLQLHCRSYVYSVARDCDNGKIDRKVRTYIHNIYIYIYLVHPNCSFHSYFSLVDPNFYSLRIVLELYCAQLKEPPKLLFR